uniref:Protein kinase domain-containing protein n=1 Tax=viral metagenome TaxID=1070528 RepID=A0A6C0F297_9ZZZZ
MSITKKRKMYMTGGIPIYPGGFSCVFNPQLKCKSKNKIRKNNTRRNNYDKTGISKLLFKQHAKMEMDNIHLFYNALKSIPKSHKYFLFTKSKLCSPAKISKRDLEGFDNMCTSFTSHEINESNINANIDSLRLINMPNAGVSVNEWLFDTNTRLTSARIILFNKIMSELIVNAIVPMNKMGVIHNDIKEDNILISLSKTNPRPTIIDWGISGISTSHNPIPEIIMNRYISISNPFSSIIFTSDFIMSYSEFLQTHNNPSSPSFQQELSSFALSQYLKFKETGHYSYVERFFIAAYTFQKKYMDINPNPDPNVDEAQIIEETYHKYAASYIADVLFHFTDFDQEAGTGTGRFQYAKYFTKVYIFNCDIWGTMCCYNVFFSIIKEPEMLADINKTKYFNFLTRLLSIFTTIIMANGDKKINVNKLITSLTNSFH